MEYCKRCVYPANARPGIVLDDEGVCSGCRLIESRPSIDWAEREKMLVDILEEYKARQRAKGNPGYAFNATDDHSYDSHHEGSQTHCGSNVQL